MFVVLLVSFKNYQKRGTLKKDRPILFEQPEHLASFEGKQSVLTVGSLAGGRVAPVIPLKLPVFVFFQHLHPQPETTLAWLSASLFSLFQHLQLPRHLRPG